MKIEKQMEEARNRNELVDHLSKLIESDDSRYSFELACGDKMFIYDKQKKISYIYAAY